MNTAMIKRGRDVLASARHAEDWLATANAYADYLDEDEAEAVREELQRLRTALD